MVTVLCSWARHFNVTLPLSSQEYKMVILANYSCGRGGGGTCNGLICSSKEALITHFIASCKENQD